MSIDIEKMARTFAERRSTPVEGIDRDLLEEVWYEQAKDIITEILPVVEAHVRADLEKISESAGTSLT